MSAQVGSPGGSEASGGLLENILCLAAGSGITLLLFIGMAHFQDESPAAKVDDLADLHVVQSIVDPPPPKVDEHPVEVAEVIPLSGLEIASSDSPVKLSVVSPDLAKIIPTTDIPPPANIPFARLYSDLRPRSNISSDMERVYMPNEVDKAPFAELKYIAHVTRQARDDADELRAMFELVIDTEGIVRSLRVLESSGNKEFDTILGQCLRHDWVFSPAIKNGKPVKCIVDQLVWYKWTVGSPFKI